MKEQEEINKELLERVEKLYKETAEREEEHEAEMDEVTTEVKASVAMAVWDAKIKLSGDLWNTGSWNVAGWREALTKLTGKPVKASQDPVPQSKEGGEKDKTKVAPGDGGQVAA